eukprot:TRINITY_DN77247_c0_g1_i1.p1 TRINITY_DN77247_c0_g1~~TRINITY_DN77247_c0_g1_i1.p1  ORF type:complete len:158 (+),score=15.99 TRINITY_DN77247_c0_g1_i1:119-592(+)
MCRADLKHPTEEPSKTKTQTRRRPRQVGSLLGTHKASPTKNGTLPLRSENKSLSCTVKSLEGEAHFAVLRRKKRLIFDFTLNGKWKCASQQDENSVAVGDLSVTDLSSDDLSGENFTVTFEGAPGEAQRKKANDLFLAFRKKMETEMLQLVQRNVET